MVVAQMRRSCLSLSCVSAKANTPHKRNGLRMQYEDSKSTNCVPGVSSNSSRPEYSLSESLRYPAVV
jgi:hypothetical protein